MKWFWPERKAAKTESDEEDEEEELEDDTLAFEYEPTEKLQMLNNYLRTSYNYCHWCGVQYDNATDIKDNCPGTEKDDH